MATQYNSILRLRKIDECLRIKSRVYHLPQLIDAIREELEKYDKKVKVSERTVYDDLKFLKDKYGPFQAPVDRTNDKGYFYKESGFSIFNPILDRNNIEKIKSSLSALRQVAGLKGFEDLQDTVLRMEASYNFDDQQRIDPIVYLEEGLNIVAQKHIEPLKKNIKDYQVISLRYKPFDKPAYGRIVSPYFLKEYNNRWFLFGHQHAIHKGDYEGLTNIPLDRIESISVSLREYESKGDLDIGKYLGDVIGVSVPDADKLEIKFKVYGSRRHYIETKQLHSTQKTIQMNDQYGVFTITVIPNREMYSLLLSFGQDLEIIAPYEIRKQMKIEAIEMLKRYNI